ALPSTLAYGLRTTQDPGDRGDRDPGMLGDVVDGRRFRLQGSSRTRSAASADIVRPTGRRVATCRAASTDPLESTFPVGSHVGADLNATSGFQTQVDAGPWWIPVDGALPRKRCHVAQAETARARCLG